MIVPVAVLSADGILLHCHINILFIESNVKILDYTLNVTQIKRTLAVQWTGTLDFKVGIAENSLACNVLLAARHPPFAWDQ